MNNINNNNNDNTINNTTYKENITDADPSPGKRKRRGEKVPPAPLRAKVHINKYNVKVVTYILSQ